MNKKGPPTQKVIRQDIARAETYRNTEEKEDMTTSTITKAERRLGEDAYFEPIFHPEAASSEGRKGYGRPCAKVQCSSSGNSGRNRARSYQEHK